MRAPNHELSKVQVEAFCSCSGAAEVLFENAQGACARSLEEAKVRVEFLETYLSSILSHSFRVDLSGDCKLLTDLRFMTGVPLIAHL